MIVTTPPPQPVQRPIVTVWVHGTKPEQVLPSPLKKLVQKATNSLFKTKKGLNKSSALETQDYLSHVSYALSETNPTLFPIEHFYTFGWSGKLSLQSRKKASRQLFNDLVDLVHYYEKNYGYTPEIILISHSHGGNVILHMAELNDAKNSSLTISKTILLACPIQKSTTELINHPMFERIYSLYSHTDLIQIADPQGLYLAPTLAYPILSQRHFKANPKIIQASISWKNGPLFDPHDDDVNWGSLKRLTQAIQMVNFFKTSRGLFHIEFKLLPFIRQLPAIITNLDSCAAYKTNCYQSKNNEFVIEL